MAADQSADEAVVARAANGDEAALADVFERHRCRLKQMVRLRLDRRLSGRVDPSDVLQEAFVAMAKELPAYAQRQSLPLFLWMRLVTAQRLAQLHRRHLGAAMRSASREVDVLGFEDAAADSESLAAHLVGKLTSAGGAAIRAEIQLHLRRALDSMARADREIIALRNFEELDYAEAAVVLGISINAARKRYVRALTRLQSLLARIPGLLDMD